MPADRPRTSVFDPWLLATAALLFGVVVGDAALEDAAIPGAFAALAGALVLLRIRGRHDAHAALRIAVVLACIGVGALRVALVPPPHARAQEGALVTVEGVLEHAPPPLAPSAAPERASRPRRLVLTDATVDAGHGPAAIRGSVHLVMKDIGAGLRAQSRLRAQGYVRAISPPRNPGQRDVRTDLRRAGVALVVEVDDARAVCVLEPAPATSIVAALECAREHIVDHLRTVLTPRAAGLAAALLVDVRDDLEDDDQDALLATGLIHLIAISGFHVFLLVGAARALLGFCFAPRTADAGAIGFAALYAVLAGAGAPVVRSAAGFAIARACKLWRRSVPPLAPLALAAIAIVLFDPAEAFRPGFQLSFAAVLGLVTMPAYEASAAPGFVPRAARILASAVRTSLRASAWTLPFLVFHFGRAAPWSPLLTVVLTPPFVLAFALAALELPQALCYGGVPWLHRACSAALEGFADLVRVAAALPGSTVATARGGVFALTIAIAALCAWTERRSRLALALAAVYVAALSLPGPGVEGLELVLLDVGHGQALVVRAEHGCDAMIDAGALGRDDCGEHVLLPALDALGVRTLDVLVLTHGDADHVNGAAALIAAGRVRRLVHGPAFARTATARAVLAAAAAAGIAIDTVVAGDCALDDRAGGLRIDVLGPQPAALAELSSNDAGLVLRIHHGDGVVLAPGDVQTAGIDALFASGCDLACDVLVLPHHGQREPRLGLLLERARPCLVLASRRGPFPRAEAPRLAARVGATVLATADQGALRVRLRTEIGPEPEVCKRRAEAEAWLSRVFLMRELPPIR